jgi:methyl-accepting chemotaxis protein
MVIRKKKIKNRFSFSMKLVVMFGIPMLCICVIVVMLSSISLNKSLSKEIKSELKIASVSLESTYSNLYKGDYSRDRTWSLYKGETKISGDTSLLDTIKKETGIDTAFYFEDKTILTTLKMKSGGRANGLTLDKSIYERVMDKQTVFVPEFEVENTTYFGYFQPLSNDDGSVVGVIFSGKPAKDVVYQIENEIQKIVFPTITIMICVLLLVFAFSKGLSKSMVSTKKFLEEVAKGRLVSTNEDKVVKNKDEIGDIYNISVQLQERFKTIVSKMKDSSGMLSLSSKGLMMMSSSIYTSVNELDDGIDLIVQDASKQATETVESVDNIAKINEQIEFITVEMKSMCDTVSNMSMVEKKSYDIMYKLYETNEAVMKTVEKITEQATITNDSVVMIQKTMNIIHQIADETDLLSINASIEAARAGSAGRGFSVIAEQISNLASLSAENAKGVATVIQKLKDESNKTMKVTEEIERQMVYQSCSIKETMENFSYMKKGVEDSNISVQHITEKMAELDQSKNIILDKVKGLSDISDHFAMATEVMSDTVKSIDKRMKELEETANKLEDISQELCNGLDIFKLE